MKTITVFVAILLVTQLAGAATVVLKNGKRVEAAAVEQKGNYVMVVFADGRAQSYPVSMVDLAATDAANGVVRPQPEATPPEGPSSPFLRAVARQGEAVATIRDGDVARILAPEPATEGKPKQEKSQAPARVTVTGYTWKLVGENTWEVTISLANQGEFAASAISVHVRGLDVGGAETGQTSGTLDGELAPGAQGTVVVTLKGQEAISQLAFDVRWQEIRPAAAGSEEVTPITVPRTATPAPRPAQPPTFSIPAGASPLAVPENPLAVRDVTSAPQTVPPAPPPTD